eukprot:3928000-Alexandrium_andersonii.AAC.1
MGTIAPPGTPPRHPPKMATIVPPETAPRPPPKMATIVPPETRFAMCLRTLARTRGLDISHSIH